MATMTASMREALVRLPHPLAQEERAMGIQLACCILLVCIGWGTGYVCIC